VNIINALVWAITNKKILNIALTGTYGAGKSSILKTDEKGFDGIFKGKISQEVIRFDTTL